MEKKIAKIIVAAMLGIIILFVILIAYFIQINDNHMIMLCRRLMLYTFFIFFFVSFIFYCQNLSLNSLAAKISWRWHHFLKGKSLRKA
jgi:hypothetical protein